MTTSDDHPDALSDFPVVLTLPVLWGDMDAFGHVNNTLCIRWFESARVVYLEAAGLTHMMTGSALGPILASITCHYRRQIEYPDSIAVGARISRIGRSSMSMEHKIYNRSRDEIAADGESVVVVFDYESQRPVRVPDEIRAAIAKLEGREINDQ